MKKSLIIEEQKKDAKYNFNYFFIQIILKITRVIFIFVLLLLINQVFDYLFINIITLIFTLYTAYHIYHIISYYSYYLNDIQNTFENNDFSYIIDANIIKNKFFKGEVNYGK